MEPYYSGAVKAVNTVASTLHFSLFLLRLKVQTDVSWNIELSAFQLKCDTLIIMNDMANNVLYR